MFGNNNQSPKKVWNLHVFSFIWQQSFTKTMCGLYLNLTPFWCTVYDFVLFHFAPDLKVFMQYIFYRNNLIKKNVYGNCAPDLFGFELFYSSYYIKFIVCVKYERWKETHRKWRMDWIKTWAVARVLWLHLSFVSRALTNHNIWFTMIHIVNSNYNVYT